MSGKTPDLHKSLLKSTTLETLVSSLLYQCPFEIGLCITKEGGMAVSAVLRLVHLLAPCPSELWHPLPYTGGASGSERRLCPSSKVQKLSAWPETIRPLQRRSAALQILLGGDFFVRELWGCLMVLISEAFFTGFGTREFSFAFDFGTGVVLFKGAGGFGGLSALRFEFCRSGISRRASTRTFASPRS